MLTGIAADHIQVSSVARTSHDTVDKRLVNALAGSPLAGHVTAVAP